MHEWIEEARAAGAVLTGGTIEDDLCADGDRGRRPGLEVSCEEVFGPVVTVNAYDTLDEALALANGTRYGLQAGIFTARLDTALRASRELEFGGVVVNEAPTFRADQMPYGARRTPGTRARAPPGPCASSRRNGSWCSSSTRAGTLRGRR